MRARCVSLLASLMLFGVASSEAQGVRFGVGGTAQFGDGSRVGPAVIVDIIPGGQLGFRADASWLFETGSDILLINGDAAYHLRTSSPSIHPFLLGGGSLAFAMDCDGDCSEFGINGGVGANFHRSGSSLGFFGDARLGYFFDSEDVRVQLMAGVRFGENE